MTDPRDALLLAVAEAVEAMAAKHELLDASIVADLWTKIAALRSEIRKEEIENAR